MTPSGLDPGQRKVSNPHVYSPTFEQWAQSLCGFCTRFWVVDHNFQCPLSADKELQGQEDNMAYPSYLHVYKSNCAASKTPSIWNLLYKISVTDPNPRNPLSATSSIHKGEFTSVTWIQGEKENGSHDNLAQCFRPRHLIILSPLYQVLSLIRYFFTFPKVSCMLRYVLYSKLTQSIVRVSQK